MAELLIDAGTVLLGVAVVAVGAIVSPPRWSRRDTAWDLRIRERRLRLIAAFAFVAGVALIAVAVTYG